jgi:hypothetical protein
MYVMYVTAGCARQTCGDMSKQEIICSATPGSQRVHIIIPAYVFMLAPDLGLMKSIVYNSILLLRNTVKCRP